MTRDEYIAKLREAAKGASALRARLILLDGDFFVVEIERLALMERRTTSLANILHRDTL